jgi:hypothetical protein
MNKLLFISLAMLFVSAMFVPQAMTKSHKVEYCHLTDWVDIPQNEWTLAVGHVISVSKNAARSHKSHNDFEFDQVFGIDEPSIIDPLTWREVAEVLGLDLDGVECAGFVIDEVF